MLAEFKLDPGAQPWQHCNSPILDFVGSEDMTSR